MAVFIFFSYGQDTASGGPVFSRLGDFLPGGALFVFFKVDIVSEQVNVAFFLGL